MKPIRKVGLVTLILGFLLFNPKFLFDCLPFSPEALFVVITGPDLPRENFYSGRLGLLQATYYRKYLFVAYRFLGGLGMETAKEQAPPTPQIRTEAQGDSPINLWYQARAVALPAEVRPPIDPYRTVRETSPQFIYFNYLNCNNDAFITAAKTLDNRITRFGAHSPEVKEWVRGQDQVFLNCGGISQYAPANTPPPPIPSPVASNSPQWLRADRDYQIAAANFYAGHFDVAQREFGAIAHDPSSPWATMAPYLAARALVRKATVNSSSFQPDVANLAQAEARLKTILDQKDQASMHPAAARLLKFVDMRLHPGEELVKISRRISTKYLSDGYSNDVGDFLYLLDYGRWTRGLDIGSSRPRADQIAATLAALRGQSDLADWILTFQDNSPQSSDHSIERWEATHSLPWLVAALSHLHADNPKKAELFEAADKIGRTSPAFEVLAFHGARVLVESGDREEALKRMNSLLGQKHPALSTSTRNMLLALRLNDARSLDEFLVDAQRIPAAASSRDSDDQIEEVEDKDILFDADSTQVLNSKMPLPLLARAAHNDTISSDLQRELAIGAWTRAILLDNEKVALEMIPILKELAPELTEGLKVYRAATSGAAKKFAATLLLLKFPGMGPYWGFGFLREQQLDEFGMYRNNWWCQVGPPPSSSGSYTVVRYFNPKAGMSEPLKNLYQGAHLNATSFMNAQEIQAGEQDWKQLATLPAAPNYLAQIVIDWSKSHRDDPRVPEALYLAGRATRNGCVDHDSTKYSKEIFEILHRRFPHTEWAQKTPYWYKY